jgi:hypothetical protein
MHIIFSLLFPNQMPSFCMPDPSKQFLPFPYKTQRSLLKDYRNNNNKFYSITTFIICVLLSLLNNYSYKKSSVHWALVLNVSGIKDYSWDMAARRTLNVVFENGRKTSKIINDVNAYLFNCSLFYAKLCKGELMLYRWQIRFEYNLC